MKRLHIILPVIVVILLSSLMLLTSCAESKKYATDYPIDVLEHNYVLDDWDIWKQEDDGIYCLQIDNSNGSSSDNLIDQLSFWVYDSDSLAKDEFSQMYEDSKKFSKDYVWEEGKNWFVSDHPYILDAYATWIVCREGNVIIEGYLSKHSALMQGLPDKVIFFNEPTTDGNDNNPLKKYVIGNSIAIRDFVINKLLTE